jgi:DNA-binding SARP family transcriptional activator
LRALRASGRAATTWGAGNGRDRPRTSPARVPIAVRPPPRYLRATDGLDFRVLGPLQVAANDTSLPLGGAKQRAVLAVLLLHANEVVPADRLIDQLWGESPPESAANMLQGYVSHLRKTLEPGRARGEHELLVSRPPGYVLRIGRDQLDAARFRRLKDEGERLLDEGDPRAAAERFRAALALWRGPALADVAYESFAQPGIARLEEARLVALEERIDAELALGRHDALVAELRGLVAEHPLRERLQAQLMVALYRCGRQAEALEVYREGRQALDEELGIEPGPALRALEQAILRQDPELGAVAAPRPLVSRIGRRRGVIAFAIVLAVAPPAAGLAVWRSTGTTPLVVQRHSVAVVDPSKNAVVADIPVGAYPGSLTADDEFVYVGNIGDATMSRIDPATRKVYDTSSLSRAIDLVVVLKHLWAANGGVAGHTPYPPGTVVDYDLAGAATRMIRVGPSVDGDEEQTTIATDSKGGEIWAGNKDSRTVTQLEPTTMAKVHGLAPGGLAVVDRSQAKDTVWASDPSRNRVVRIEGTPPRITHRVAIPGEPSRLVANARSVWVIARDNNGSAQWRPTRATRPALWRIDATTNEPAALIRLPLTPIRVAFGASSVWVTAMRVLSPSGFSDDATVFRIDPQTNRIVARIPLETRAVDGIVVSHGLVWVAIPQTQQ